MARTGEGNTPPSTSSTAPMRVIEQPIVSGAANNEVRKPGPVAYSCGWLTAADVRLRWQDTSGRLDCNYRHKDRRSGMKILTVIGMDLQSRTSCRDQSGKKGGCYPARSARSNISIKPGR